MNEDMIRSFFFIRRVVSAVRESSEAGHGCGVCESGKMTGGDLPLKILLFCGL